MVSSSRWPSSSRSEAIENIDAILEAPLSAILMVPGDTSLSMGLGPFGTVETHPEVDDMYARVLEACQAQDKGHLRMRVGIEPSAAAAR